MTATENSAPDFGTNSWLVDEMYAQYLSDTESVSESWREFFSDYRGAAPATFGAHAAPPAPVAASPESPPFTVPPATPSGPPGPTPGTLVVADDVGEPIRGAGLAIAANMERSLSVPTATSFRNIPAKLLEVNRKVINGYRSRSGQGKVSFTHLIGFAIVRAIADAVPNMNNTYAEGADGKPKLIRNEHVGMGLAVDVAKADGSRTLVVPVLREADSLDFAGFLAAYEELIR